MWVSDEYKIQWWLPPRTASRMTVKFLQKLKFRQEFGHHTVFGNSRYDVYLNIRNPYSIVVSYFFLTHQQFGYKDFSEFVKKTKGEYYYMGTPYLLDYIEAFRDRKLEPAKIIRYENFFEDLTSIEIIKSNEKLLELEMKILELETLPWRKNYKEEFLKPYSEFYTKELADIIYENRQKYFEFGGYDRDSWKTLIN